MSTHQCPIPGCTWQVPDDRLMCLNHWRLVPAFTQRQVTVAWNAVRSSKIAQKRVDAIERYRDARQAAIDSLTHLAPLL